MGTEGSRRLWWPLWSLLLLLLLLGNTRARAQAQLDGSGAQEQLDGSRAQAQLDGSGTQEQLDGSRAQEQLNGSRAQEQLHRSGAQEQLNGSRAQEELDRSRAQEQLDRSRAQEELDRSGAQEQLDGSRAQEQLDRSGAQEELDRSGAQEQLDGSGAQEQLHRFGAQEQLDGSRAQEQLHRSGAQEQLDGSRAQEQLDGSGAQEQLDGSGAQEQLDGSGAQEQLNGSRAQEQLDGSRAQEQLNGSRAQEQLHRSGAQEQLNGSRAQEELDGSGAQEQLDGSGAQEELDGSGAQEQLDGSRAQEELDRSGAQEELDQSGAQEQLDGSGAQEQLHRSGAQEELDGSRAQEQLDRSRAQEELYGSGAQEELDRSGAQEQLDRSRAQEELDRSGAQESGAQEELDRSGAQEQLDGSRAQEELDRSGTQEELDRSGAQEQLNGSRAQEQLNGSRAHEQLDGSGAQEELYGSGAQEELDVSGDQEELDGSGAQEQLDRSRAQEELDGSGAQEELDRCRDEDLDGDREGMGLATPSVIKRRSKAILYRSFEEEGPQSGWGGDQGSPCTPVTHLGPSCGPMVVAKSAWKVPNTYLVVFHESQSQWMRCIVHLLQSKAASQGLMFEVLHVFKDLFPGILMKVDKVGTLDLILRLKQVKFVEEDSFAFAQSLLWIPHRISPQWNQFLSIMWNTRRVSSEWDELNSFNHRNKDNPVEVYLLGTSIQPNHMEIKGRINISNFERVPKEEWQSTSARWIQQERNCESHGTHLAALVNGQSVGVAKDIKIHSLRVLNCQGKGTVSGILMGLEFLWKKLVSNPSKRMVVLLPLVSGYSQNIKNACKLLARAGAVLVAAAGNFQSNACAYSPASSPEVITVGAVDFQDQPLILGPLGTNYGSCVDIFAPGKNIVSASKDCNVCYAMQSGTSQAAARVAGIAALLLTAQPNLTVAELRQRLIHYSTRNAINDTRFPEEERFKTPNLVAAMPLSTQETGTHLLCRNVWSAPWNLRRRNVAKAWCNPGEELLGCSSFSQSGMRQGERLAILGNRRVCLAFGDRQVSAVARCCVLPQANCSIHTAPPISMGLKTYIHCPDPDQVLTGCSSHWEVENLGDYPHTSKQQGDQPRQCVGHKEASVHASCCHAPGLQCTTKKYSPPSPLEKVTVSCDAGWTLTSCSAHPETSVTLGAFPVDNTCVVKHQGPHKRGWMSKEFVIVTAICCRIELSGQP
ncbi:PREDICTED: proprotein convertase subtilisin/kexin type 9-like [Dipodomys ordii]|uniref:Proprotein convertase subtilisin/kexin type 9-like n=1 Tax=Dipodomys ordii TaxID=10020 RepID=A0A1S3FMT8_DIPOR|nr:PREDICTED: proprotein convertase subtilisin/kexin type 9-like [Dipodomys ordii]